MGCSRLCRCGAIVDGRCEKCSGNSDRIAGKTTSERGYDYKWRQLSASYRAHYPLCERCRELGIATEASEVHHKIPIRVAPDRRLDWSNLMSVCGPCHKKVERATR